MSNNGLKQQVALVTGASRGLGAAIVMALARKGAQVGINYVSNQSRAIAVKEAILAEGGMAEIFQADVTDEQQVIRLCEEVRQKLGEVDILVLNATSHHYHYKIEELRWEHMLEMMHFFVKSPLLLTQQVIGDMKQKKRGRIIHIGSEVFDQGIPEFSNYVAAKGAQLGLCRSWARELAPFGITVNYIAPGWIPTDMHVDTPAEVKENYRRAVPMQHMGEPADVASMVAFLASEEAKFITGQKISVNGGNTLS
ncbi:SDR family NAD(P)-dependent oxidoreductase [Catalinimonas niigatensis]|uniref:SDR family NAD(P)-dependent oxidoreductase n=1 Tax=Catalinimonas niigatensis TaxID=1397264 RepID=UPI0026670F30|nr:SDR family oxidoreductase [Catalinimonas niigatensis]WPP51460.1 SDR family oxidoreductase [Catalinimonas niigatensis]